MADVGRKRLHDTDLPRYWKRSNGAIYLIVPKRYEAIGRVGSWVRLGAELDEAHRAFADLLAGERAGTMQQLFDKFTRERLDEKTSTLGEKTLEEYQRQIRKLGDWCGRLPQGGLKTHMVQAYVDQRPPVAANRELSLLNQICKKGIRWRMLTENPCNGVERNKERPAREGADHLSMMIAWREARPWMRALMAMAYVIGQRRGDVRKIRDTDFTGRGLLLGQNKTGTELLIEWTPNLRAAHAYALEVRRVASTERWLIPTSHGTPVSQAHFKREWKRIQAKVIEAGAPPFMFKSIRAQSATDHETGFHLGHVDRRVLDSRYRLGPRKVRPI